MISLIPDSCSTLDSKNSQTFKRENDGEKEREEASMPNKCFLCFKLGSNVDFFRNQHLG